MPEGIAIVKMKSILVAALVCGSLATSRARATAQGIPRGLYERTVRSAALIYPLDRPFVGSGFLVDRERKLVITNYHVVEQTSRVDVIFPAYDEGELITQRDYYYKHERTLAYRGRVVSRHPHHDLALIQLEQQPRGVPGLRLAARSPRVGDRLYRLGTPGAKGSPTWKCIPGTVTHFESQVNQVKARIVVTNCGGRYGDSGAAVVNARGELAGVHFAGSGSHSDAVEVRAVRALVQEWQASFQTDDVDSYTDTADEEEMPPRTG
jgi:S1-C subfamily serine protease